MSHEQTFESKRDLIHMNSVFSRLQINCILQKSVAHYKLCVWLYIEK